MRREIEAAALRRQRPVIFLRSRDDSKEAQARQVAAQEKITEGVICVFSAQETGRVYEACPNRATRMLELHLREKRCIHLYVYLPRTTYFARTRHAR